MASLKIFALLAILLCAVVSQTFASIYVFDDAESIAAAERLLLRTRRSPDHHHQGITGPVHTFVKTDKHANFKWGVRHHVGHKYA